MRKHLLLMVGAVALICSCVPSVNPFYTEKDVVTDPRLVGEWLEADNKDNPSDWTFETTETNSYKLTVMEGKDKKGEFDAHLFRLKQEYFLDLIPTSCDYATNQAGLVGAAMIPGHLLVRVSQFEPTLHLALCDPDWLKKYLQANPKAIAHRTDEDFIVLTADTADLQKFVMKHLGKGELFSDGGDMIRQTNNVPAATK
jgi:hypothetical protein